MLSLFFFFNDTATTEIYTLSLHDALPILYVEWQFGPRGRGQRDAADYQRPLERDRKSTRLNSSHDQISYAVFCLKKKNTAFRRSVVMAARADHRLDSQVLDVPAPLRHRPA